MKILGSTFTFKEKLVTDFLDQMQEEDGDLLLLKGSSSIDRIKLAIPGGRHCTKAGLVDYAKSQYTYEQLCADWESKGKHIEKKADVVGRIRKCYSGEKRKEFNQWANGKFNVPKGTNAIDVDQICIAKAMADDSNLVLFDNDLFFLKALEDYPAPVYSELKARDIAIDSGVKIHVFECSESGIPIYGIEFHDIEPILFGGRYILIYDSMYLHTFDVRRGIFIPSQYMPYDNIANVIHGDYVLGWLPWSFRL